MKPRGVTERKGIIAWFASNHVAANLLMYLIIVAGLLSASTIRKQMQPDFELNNVQVQVLYLGAAPQEVEEGVVIKVEEAILTRQLEQTLSKRRILELYLNFAQFGPDVFGAEAAARSSPSTVASTIAPTVAAAAWIPRSAFRRANRRRAYPLSVRIRCW